MNIIKNCGKDTNNPSMRDEFFQKVPLLRDEFNHFYPSLRDFCKYSLFISLVVSILMN